MSYLSKISTTTDANWKQEIWFFTKSSAISPKGLNLFAFIDCNKAGHAISDQSFSENIKNGQCLYYRNVLFQLMCKTYLAGFAHCAIFVKQWSWNRTNWKRQNLFNSNVLSTIYKNQCPTENLLRIAMNSDCVPRTILQLSFLSHIFEWLQLGPCNRIVDGRSLSGLPSCAIFRKTLTTVPTNDFLTTCKH